MPAGLARQDDQAGGAVPGGWPHRHGLAHRRPEAVERLKQPVVVENRAGASGSIAAAQVSKSPADGYTLMMLATPTLLAPHLYKKAGYDTVKDFTPVATVYDLPIVVVVNPKQLPDVTDLKGLIANAKAQKTPAQLHQLGRGQLWPPEHGAAQADGRL
jgi:tripartite-type tricarboxylate transporter receptor subunit TctC